MKINPVNQAFINISKLLNSSENLLKQYQIEILNSKNSFKSLEKVLKEIDKKMFTPYYKIADESFNEEIGLSTITIATKHGHFSGMARVHPDDLEKHHYTSLGGKHIACLRAFISYLKFLKQLDRNTHKEILHLWAENKKDSKLAHMLELKLHDLEYYIKSYNQMIKDTKEDIAEYIEDMDKYFAMRDKTN